MLNIPTFGYRGHDALRGNLHGQLISRGLWALFAVIAVLVFPSVLVRVYGDAYARYLPSFASQSPALLFAAATIFIRSPANRFIFWFWFAWYFVGCFNALSSYAMVGVNYRPALSEPTLIYFSFTAAMCWGMVAGERIYGLKPLGAADAAPVRRTLSLGEASFPLMFTLFWAASIVIWVGYIPVLSGFNITESIYETNYGPLYGFGLMVVIAAVVALVRSNQFTSRPLRWLAVAAFLAVILLSVTDGKRYFAILIVLASCFALQRLWGGAKARAKISLFVASAAVLYLVVYALRLGSTVGSLGEGWMPLTYIAGVEFRDFAFTVTRYEPGTIPNYDWFSSGLGSAINGKLLGLLGLDKAALIDQGSAFAWSRIFNSPFGIRTGIVSELWFAYGWYGVILIFLIGFVTSRVSLGLERAATDVAVVNRSVLLALLASLVMGQTTAVTGLMTVLLYVNIAYWLYRHVRSSASRASSFRFGQ